MTLLLRHVSAGSIQKRVSFNSFRQSNAIWRQRSEPTLTQVPGYWLADGRRHWGLVAFTWPWWRHQMETFPRYWPFVRGIHRSPVNSPHQGQWRGAFMFSLICALNKRLSKQSRGWWFETPSRPLWRHHNEIRRKCSSYLSLIRVENYQFKVTAESPMVQCVNVTSPVL